MIVDGRRYFRGNFIRGVFWIILAVVFFGAYSMSGNENFRSFTIAFAAVGLIRVAEYFITKRDKEKADEKMREKEIALNDERNLKNSGTACCIACIITVLLMLITSVTLLIVDETEMYGIITAGWAILLAAVYAVAYIVLSKIY